MSEDKGRFRTEPAPATASQERLADVLIQKGGQKLEEKLGTDETTLEADQLLADPGYVANKIMKEAAHVLQREEAANTGSTQAGGLAAAAQAVVAKKDGGHPGEPIFETAGIVEKRIKQYQEMARQGGNFMGPNPEGSRKAP